MGAVDNDEEVLEPPFVSLHKPTLWSPQLLSAFCLSALVLLCPAGANADDAPAGSSTAVVAPTEFLGFIALTITSSEENQPAPSSERLQRAEPPPMFEIESPFGPPGTPIRKNSEFILRVRDPRKMIIRRYSILPAFQRRGPAETDHPRDVGPADRGQNRPIREHEPLELQPEFELPPDTQLNNPQPELPLPVLAFISTALAGLISRLARKSMST